MKNSHIGLNENIGVDTLESENMVDTKKIWQKPEIIVIQSSLNIEGNPTALFEDNAGIAHS